MSRLDSAEFNSAWRRRRCKYMCSQRRPSGLRRFYCWLSWNHTPALQATPVRQSFREPRPYPKITIRNNHRNSDERNA
jgi:hypothetical protein